MKTIDAKVSDRTIELSEKEIVQGGINEDRLKVEFPDDEWAEMTKTAYFTGSDVTKAVTVTDDGYVTVPWETIERTGDLAVSFIGTTTDKRLTTRAKPAWLTIVPCGAIEGGNSATPTVDKYSDLEKAISELKTKVDAMTDVSGVTIGALA